MGPSKLTKAKALNIELCSEEDFLKKIADPQIEKTKNISTQGELPF